MVQHLERARPPGRNDPCPCGSGKKYKKCCLVHEVTLPLTRQFDDIVAELYAADEIGDARTAIQILEEARDTLHVPDLDIMLAERYLEMSPAEAETRLRDWWNQEHDRFSGAGLAQVLITQGRREEALTVLADSQGMDAPPEYWRLLATLREEHGELEAAVPAMELYARLSPEDADAWSWLAGMQQQAGYDDRALLSLRRAADAAPERIVPRIQRLQILAKMGRWREVRDQAEPLLEGVYEDATAETRHDLRALLARAHASLGEIDAARLLWEELLERQPDDVEIRFYLADLELASRRYRRALLVLERYPNGEQEWRVLDIRLQCSLALHEYEEAARVALQMNELHPSMQLLPLVRAAEAVSYKEYDWALEQLAGEPPAQYRNLWISLRLDCLARLCRWSEVPFALKAAGRPDDAVLLNAALGTLAAGKLDLTERLIEEIEDQQSTEVRFLSELLGPVRQSRRAAEARRQQQVDQAEKGRWAAENRELRRRIRDLERHNTALTETLDRSEAAVERLLDFMGVSGQGDTPADWEAQLQRIAQRAHRNALEQELQQAERRLRFTLGDSCWESLSEHARVSLREGEWLFAAVVGEDRDYGGALLAYARGLERAFKDAVFAPVQAEWQHRPGPVDRLHDESHDPSLGPFVRYVLQGGHLTLGSMATALDRMGDARRQGVAVTLLRRHLGIDPGDTRTLEDWRHTAERLAGAAEARNQPAHAGAVSREAARRFRDLLLDSGGLLQALDPH